MRMRRMMQRNFRDRPNPVTGLVLVRLAQKTEGRQSADVNKGPSSPFKGAEYKPTLVHVPVQLQYCSVRAYCMEKFRFCEEFITDKESRYRHGQSRTFPTSKQRWRNGNSSGKTFPLHVSCVGVSAKVWGRAMVKVFLNVPRYLKEFRVEQCKLFLQHKCTQHRPYTCFYWHFMNQRRRRPVRRRDGTFNYSPDMYCNVYDENTGICQNGDE